MILVRLLFGYPLRLARPVTSSRGGSPTQTGTTQQRRSTPSRCTRISSPQATGARPRARRGTSRSGASAPLSRAARPLIPRRTSLRGLSAKNGAMAQRARARCSPLPRKTPCPQGDAAPCCCRRLSPRGARGLPRQRQPHHPLSAPRDPRALPPSCCPRPTRMRMRRCADLRRTPTPSRQTTMKPPQTSTASRTRASPRAPLPPPAPARLAGRRTLSPGRTLRSVQATNASALLSTQRATQYTKAGRRRNPNPDAGARRASRARRPRRSRPRARSSACVRARRPILPPTRPSRLLRSRARRSRAWRSRRERTTATARRASLRPRVPRPSRKARSTAPGRPRRPAARGAPQLRAVARASGGARAGEGARFWRMRSAGWGAEGGYSLRGWVDLGRDGFRMEGDALMTVRIWIRLG
ncbi:hypothetical protein B0H17DRAFT_600236 [Mycena rosella]|uniref:Uncharacterized protein n=1 Tax=Mycena rosella TaxID=1033263 RepID=A0AAD7DEV3_MYCRO|nr:hypothetical protein B0H17DRAFT_600236 [Mycena rosella]